LGFIGASNAGPSQKLFQSVCSQKGLQKQPTTSDVQQPPIPQTSLKIIFSGINTAAGYATRVHFSLTVHPQNNLAPDP
jgi:hypothetical protein